MRLHTMALKAVKLHFEAGTSFSAYDITSFIRDKVNSGEWKTLDRATTKVNHKLIREFVLEMEHNDLMPGNYVVRDENNGTNVYRAYHPTTPDNTIKCCSSIPSQCDKSCYSDDELFDSIGDVLDRIASLDFEFKADGVIVVGDERTIKIQTASQEVTIKI